MPTGQVGKAQAIPTPTLVARAVVAIQITTTPGSAGNGCLLALETTGTGIQFNGGGSSGGFTGAGFAHEHGIFAGPDGQRQAIERESAGTQVQVVDGDHGGSGARRARALSPYTRAADWATGGKPE